MKHRFNDYRRAVVYGLWPVLLVALLIALAPTTAAQGETPTPTASPTVTATATTDPNPPGPLAINAVQPGTLVNDIQVELIVTGSGFVDGSVVVLNNFGGLETFCLLYTSRCV